MNILDYVDIDLSWKKGKPIFKFLIKEEKKITQDFPIKCIVNNKKISKTGEPYYVHYLGNIGVDVYRERKKLFSLYNLIPFYIKHYNKNVVELKNYLEVLHTNNSKGLVNLYKTEKGELIRKKQSDWSTAHSKEISTRNKMLWKDSEYVKKAMNRPEVIIKRSNSLKISHNKPDFVEKLKNRLYKKVLNTSNNIIYKSVQDASKITGINYSSLCSKLNGSIQNNTSLVYIK